MRGINQSLSMELYMKKLQFYIQFVLKLKPSPDLPYLSETVQNADFYDIVLHLWWIPLFCVNRL